MKWFDRNGAELGRLGEPGAFGRFRISPSGDRVAVPLRDQSINDRDLWVFDVERGVSTRLAAGLPDDTSPVWSTDGKRIAYSSDLVGVPAIYVRPADGSDAPSRLGPDGEHAAYPLDWSRDGTLIAYRTTLRNQVVRLLPVDGGGSSRAYLEAPGGGQYDARFSPDGKWVAFMSEELGTPEVFVAPLDDGNVRHRVSAAGGWNPVWGPGGRELFFQSGNSVHAASFSPETTTSGMSRVLFSLGHDVSSVQMDVTPDGKRFLVAVAEENWTRITVVLDGHEGHEEP